MDFLFSSVQLHYAINPKKTVKKFLKIQKVLSPLSRREMTLRNVKIFIRKPLSCACYPEFSRPMHHLRKQVIPHE